MTSSIIATNKGTYFTVISVTCFYIYYFTVIKAQWYESKLLVDINCCHLRTKLYETL